MTSPLLSGVLAFFIFQLTRRTILDTNDPKEVFLQLQAIEDPQERKKVFDNMVEAAYRYGKGVNAASLFEFDDVIDPLDSRKWIMTALRSAPPPAPREGKKRPCIDTW